MKKTCSKCRQEKPETEFAKSRSEKDSLYRYCRSCWSQIRKKSYLKNKAKELERNKEWSMQNKQRHRQLVHQYWENNKEKLKAGAQTCYVLNRDKRQQQIRQWKLDNPIRWRILCGVHAHKRRSRNGAAEGCYSPEDIQALLSEQNGLCNGCAADITQTFHVDHIVPISRGGSNWPDNLQLLCRSCNCSKGAKLPEEWLEWRERIGSGLQTSCGKESAQAC